MQGRTVKEICSEEVRVLGVTTNFIMHMSFNGVSLDPDLCIDNHDHHPDDTFRLRFYPARGGKPVVSWNLSGLSVDRSADLREINKLTPVAVGIQETHLTMLGQQRTHVGGWHFIWGSPCDPGTYTIRDKMGIGSYVTNKALHSSTGGVAIAFPTSFLVMGSSTSDPVAADSRE